MKHTMKKIFASAIAMVMVLSLAVPAFAAEAQTEDEGTVTISVTYGMFTEGGYHNGPVAQTYRGGVPTSNDVNANFGILNYEVSISDVEMLIGIGIQEDVYDAPYALPANVLDAIITAFYYYDQYDIKGGWDADPEEGQPGGYINSVGTVIPAYGDTKQVTENGIVYDVYTGTGWNIAVAGNADSEFSALTMYGSSIALKDGMQIIFDFSPYALYSEAETNS